MHIVNKLITLCGVTFSLTAHAVASDTSIDISNLDQLGEVCRFDDYFEAKEKNQTLTNKPAYLDWDINEPAPDLTDIDIECLRVLSMTFDPEIMTRYDIATSTSPKALSYSAEPWFQGMAETSVLGEGLRLMGVVGALPSGQSRIMMAFIDDINSQSPNLSCDLVNSESASQAWYFDGLPLNVESSCFDDGSQRVLTGIVIDEIDASTLLSLFTGDQPQVTIKTQSVELPLSTNNFNDVWNTYSKNPLPQ